MDLWYDIKVGNNQRHLNGDQNMVPKKHFEILLAHLMISESFDMFTLWLRGAGKTYLDASDLLLVNAFSCPAAAEA